MRESEASNSEMMSNLRTVIPYLSVLLKLDWRELAYHFRKSRHVNLPIPQERMKCVNLVISSFDNNQGRISQNTVSSSLLVFSNLFSVTAVSNGSVIYNDSDVVHHHYSQVENVDTKEGFYSDRGTAPRRS